MGFFRQEAGGLSYYGSSLLAACPEVIHGYFTRQGGVSQEPWRSLNLSYTVGDRGEAVAANQVLVQQALSLKGLASAGQVHGSNGTVVTAAASEAAAEIPEVDILITATLQIGLLIRQADCQAVMLYDPVHRVAANVHAGWRGQVENILGGTVARLSRRFGSRPPELLAAIGPSLGPCCAEFRHFRQELPPPFWSYQVRPQYFDLWRLSRDQLSAAGLKPENIDIAGVCTRCRPEEFFSYRRDKITGRQGAVIALRQ